MYKKKEEEKKRNSRNLKNLKSRHTFRVTRPRKLLKKTVFLFPFRNRKWIVGPFMSRKHAFLNDILKITSRFKEPCREVCGKKEKKKKRGKTRTCIKLQPVISSFFYDTRSDMQMMCKFSPSKTC